MAWVATLELVDEVLIAAFVVFLPLEVFVLWRTRRLGRQALREMLASTAPLVPTLLLSAVTLSFIMSVFTTVARFSVAQVPTSALSVIGCIVMVDFLYYVDHRCGHRVALYWAVSHSVHHSSPNFDQTTGFRVSFVDGFLSPWFYLPAVAVGFSPELVAAAFGFVMGYQQWLHTETIGKLGWFDSVFNSPSNHRVHHGSQERYLDKNYGGFLIIWDRLFGTYAAENEAPRYGLTKPIESTNPITVHIAGMVEMWQVLVRARSWKQRLVCLVAPPGSTEELAARLVEPRA